MTILIAASLIAILLIANHRATEDADVTPACSAGVWLLAIVAFVVLLSVASIVGASLADPRIMAQLGGGP